MKPSIRTALVRPARASQRGMSLLEIMIVLAIMALVMGLVVGPRVYRMFSSSRGDTTKIKVEKLANEAFPEWASRNPTKQCPSSLAELGSLMNSEDLNDAWGNPLKMFCGSTLPAGVPKGTGVAVMSAGEDGNEGTEDDICSWDCRGGGR